MWPFKKKKPVSLIEHMNKEIFTYEANLELCLNKVQYILKLDLLSRTLHVTPGAYMKVSDWYIDKQGYYISDMDEKFIQLKALRKEIKIKIKSLGVGAESVTTRKILEYYDACIDGLTNTLGP